MQFTELELPPGLQKGLDEAGYVTCMPIQEQVFSHSFQGKDIFAQSQTGTGKTAAFLISIFQRILTVPDLGHKKALILAPTRELAVQIQEEADRLGRHISVSTGAFYGGVGYGPQLDMLKDDVQIIIGTPGRITDLLQQGRMKLNEVGFLVIDEADRMFDMGFVDDLRRLLRYLPQASRRQTYLFSATLGLRVKDLAWEYMDNPTEIVIEPEHITVELVTQELYHVGAYEKFRLLLGILDREKPKSAIIFCNQKNMVEEVARRLRINGVESDYIIGDLPQSKRQSIINNLKEGRLEILVATDVAARGLDIDALDLVVNYDVPNEPESYVHRIGRTARAGKSGKAVTLACEKFVFGLPAVEKFVGNKIPVLPFGEEMLPEDRSARIQFRHGHDRPSPDRRASDRRTPEHRPAERRPAERRPAERPGSDRDSHRPNENRVGQQGPHGRNGSSRINASSGGAVHGAVAHGGSVPGGRGQALPRNRSGAPSGLPTGLPAADSDKTTAPSIPAKRTPVPTGASPAGDPYSLPQDERMRMYRERYATGGSLSGVRQNPEPTKTSSSVQIKTQPIPETPEAPAPKQGILSRIVALFKGKR